MKQKLLKFLHSLESGKISAKRRNAGYIMLAGELILLSVLIACYVLFDLDIVWEEYWALIILLPAAVALIVSFGLRPWNIYPLTIAAVERVYWTVENIAWNAYGAVHFNSNTPEKTRYRTISDFGDRLWVVYVTLAFVTLGIWLIVRIVKKAKREALAQNNDTAT